MIYLAIDLGGKRTGLAVGDDFMKIASPVDTIVTAGEEERFRQILLAIKDQGAEALIVGLPLNMDGSEGKPAKDMRRFARELAKRSGLAVYLTDERQTSMKANDKMAQTGLTHKQKKNRRDKLAAAEILKMFWERGAVGEPIMARA